jgi:nicotinate-nucleotide adenylyltransferase
VGVGANESKTDKPLRIGYFGGTFDPPHRAHLLVARAAAAAFALDRVLLAPTGLQPLKSAAPLASYSDRVAMTRLLCADDGRLEVSELDEPHEDGRPNYTIDALGQLRTDFPGAEIFIIVGADSFATLPKWHEHDRLIAEAEWIVVSRPDWSLEALPIPEEQRARVHLLSTVNEDISSTGIRERLRVGVSCDKLLTPTVSLYIARMHLYHAT